MFGPRFIGLRRRVPTWSGFNLADGSAETFQDTFVTATAAFQGAQPPADTRLIIDKHASEERQTFLRLCSVAQR